MVDYEKQIENMIQELKQENPQREISFKENYILNINGTKIDVSILDIKEPMEKDDEKTNMNKIQILYKTEEGYILIAEVTSDKEIMLYNEGMKKTGLDKKFEVKESNRVELRESDEREREEEKGNKERADNEKPNLKEQQEKQEQQEKEKQQENNNEIDKKNWQEIDLGREFTDEEDFREYIRATLKVSLDKLYRVKTGTHSFKYVGEKDGEYTELDLTEQYEGTNTRQKVYIVQEDGEMVLDEVDSLLLTKDGNHGIATKNADVGTTDVTKSFAVTRERGGKYVATQLIEKSGQNRDPRLPGKELFDRGRGIEDIDKTIDSIEEIENKDLEIAEDEITVQEISLYEYFEMKGYREEEIDEMIKYMEEEEKTVDEAEKRQENVRLTVGAIEEKLSKENPNAMPGQNRYFAQQIAKKMQASNYELTYEAAKEELTNGKESEQSTDQKIPGENPRKAGH